MVLESIFEVTRKAIRALQAYIYDTDDILLLHSHAEKLPWFVILITPILGGLIVGIILHKFTDDGRVRSCSCRPESVPEGPSCRPSFPCTSTPSDPL